VPVVVTLHTVLKLPSPNQAAIVQKLFEQCAQLIVMSEVARDLLASSYGVRGPKVTIIPHGIPVMDRDPDQQALKAKFGVRGRRRPHRTKGWLSFPARLTASTSCCRAKTARTYISPHRATCTTGTTSSSSTARSTRGNSYRSAIAGRRSKRTLGGSC